MPPPSRSPGIVNPVSPSLVASARDNYTTSTPHLTRHTLPARNSSELLSRSPHSPLPSTPRSAESAGIALSPSSSTTLGGRTSSLQLDPSSQLALGAGTAGPPLEATLVLHRIASADGHNVQPEIHARIDKGFFLADQDWTCYRRNYFSVACSYSLRPPVVSTLFLNRNSAVPENIIAFAMSISAVVDGSGGKAIELVQHTPKRDKGPQGKPDRVKLSPQPAAALGAFPGLPTVSNPLLSGSQVPGQQEYEQSYSQQSQQQQTVANFDRIQFKSATANNGKRRAAQQYYHLIVELYAEIGGHPSNTLGPDGRLVKVATRISAPMVVRGRSPGHYQDDRRASSSSTGPGGAGGGDSNGGASIPPSGPSSGTRNLGESMSNSPLPVIGSSNSMLGGSGYQASSALSSHHHSPAGSSVNGHSLSSASSSGGHLDTPIDPILSTEEASSIEEYPSYQYYPSPLYDSQISQSRPSHGLPGPQMPSYRDERSNGPPYAAYDGDIRAYSTGEARRPIKEEYMGPSLPNLASTWHFGGSSGRDYNRSDTLRRCGRFEGTESSRGYYPDLPAL
ncbi:MAG: hypothetical protein M1839_000322 [Geoglossum umbratile]|nr:MAG: hypothetical protein M1839_000322 [Geoglossum umbratile]